MIIWVSIPACPLPFDLGSLLELMPRLLVNGVQTVPTVRIGGESRKASACESLRLVPSIKVRLLLLQVQQLLVSNSW